MRVDEYDFFTYSGKALYYRILRAKAMGKIKDNMAKLKCSECGRITHYTKRNKKKVKEKLSLSKYCRFCKKNNIHTESK